MPDVRHTFSDVENGTDVETVGVRVTLAEGGRGLPGPEGDPGPPGDSPILLGTLATVDDLPVDGAPGDLWFVGTVLWGWDDDEELWIEGADLQGDPGADGAGVVATVVAPLVLTGDELSIDDSGYEVAGAADAVTAAQLVITNALDGRLDTLEAVDYATQAELDAHVDDTSAAHAATAVSFAPVSTIAATTVQAAIAEVNAEKMAPADLAAAVLALALTDFPAGLARDTEVTTAVADAIAAVISSAPGALDTLDELAAALGDDANYAATITAALALKAPLASPTFTGTPAAPTASAATSTTQVATTAFVTTADNLKANIASPTFTGTPAAPTPTAADSTTKVATTAFVQGELTAKAPLASPALTGNPTAPTQSAGNNSTRLATTAYVDAADALKAALASPTFTGDPKAPTPSAGDNDTSVATTAFVKAAIDKQPEVLIVALSDETTAITTGTAKVTMRMPFAMTLTAVRASLTTASSSGTPTVDINEAGSTILSTKLTIDASELTSTTAATAAVISDASLADDAEITFDVDVAGTGAKGLKVYLIGTRT